jgi:flagellar hook protein FlgE
MSLISSMYTGASGLESNSTDLSVIGDNIANANTIGFKASRVSFSDAMAQQMIGSGSAISQVGLGTQVQAVQRIITQGALTNTGLATDLAIDGNGFFIVSGAHNGRNGQFLSRAGQFTLDKEGYLVNLGGLMVQGYTADVNGTLGTSPGSLKIGNSESPPLATSTISARANLDSSTPVIVGAFDPADPSATSNFSNSVTVYDSLGTAHQVDIYYRKTAVTATEHTWQYHVMSGGTELTTAPGELDFDLDGTLLDHTQATVTFNPAGATNPQPLDFNFGDPTAAGGTGRLGITQFANASGTAAMDQNGFSSGSLTSISIDKNGNVNGSFTNGRNRVLGQVATALVSAPDKMERLGGNLFAVNRESGQATLGSAGSAGRGGIVAGALEQSNVDLANEFVRMITAQRGYQASSKTVTTADQLLSELMTLKR